MEELICKARPDVQALQHWMQSDYLTNVEKAMEAMEVVSGHANTRDVIITCGEASPPQHLHSLHVHATLTRGPSAVQWRAVQCSALLGSDILADTVLSCFLFSAAMLSRLSS